MDEWEAGKIKNQAREGVTANGRTRVAGAKAGGGAVVIWSKGAVVGSCEHEAGGASNQFDRQLFWFVR